MPLEKIIENLELVVGPFALCDIHKGWRLNLAAPNSVVLHFVLAGSVELHYRSTCHTLTVGTMVMIPPNLAHSVQAGPTLSGGEIDGDPSTLPTGTTARITLGEDDPVGFEMLCGRVEATYGGASGIFDTFEHAVIVDLSEEPAVPALFDALHAEQAGRKVGGTRMLCALMQQCFILMLRRLERDGFEPLETLSALQDPQLGKVMHTIMDAPGSTHTVESLATVAGMSRSQFSDRFRAAFRRTPMDYVREVRLRRAAALLRRTDLGVEAIASEVGYSSRTHFSKAFSEHFNLSPRDFRTALSVERAQPQLG